MPCIPDVRVPPAAAGLHLERRLRRLRACVTMVIVRSERDSACDNPPGASCISADLRGSGMSVGGGSVAPRAARLFKVSRRCADRPGTGMARDSCSWPLTAVTASAGFGYIGSIMCPVVCDRSPPEYAICGADPSSGHQARMLVRGPGGSDDVSAKRCSCSRALAGLAVSDPKARSALYV